MKFFITLVLLISAVAASAQSDSIQPAYKRFPTYPPLQILLGDSTTKYTKDNLVKKKPVLVMVFSPDCEHCQHEAEEMVKYKDEIKDFQIVMVTFQPLWKMNAFVEKYQLNTVPNVVVGKDIYYLLTGFYEMKNLPFVALYNKKGDLITVSEGALGIRKIAKILKENN